MNEPAPRIPGTIAMDVDRSRAWGLGIIGSAALVAIVWLDGLRRRKYWALALPVLLLFGGALYVAFWVGRVLATNRGIEDDEPDDEEEAVLPLGEMSAG